MFLINVLCLFLEGRNEVVKQYLDDLHPFNGLIWGKAAVVTYIIGLHVGLGNILVVVVGGGEADAP
jgi:hypothetical protein